MADGELPKKSVAKRAKVPASVPEAAMEATAPETAAVPLAEPATPSPALAEPAPAPAVAPPAPPPAERIEAMTESVMKPFEQAVPAIEKATAETVAHAKASYEQMNTKMSEMMEQAMKSMTEMSEFAKGNLEAMMASAKAATAGAETLSSTMVETSKKQLEEAQAAWKAMASAKTPNEMLTAQNEFAKAQFEKTVAAWSHLSETMLKLTGEVVQPLSNRMAVAAETVKKGIAA